MCIEENKRGKGSVPESYHRSHPVDMNLDEQAVTTNIWQNYQLHAGNKIYMQIPSTDGNRSIDIFVVFKLIFSNVEIDGVFGVHLL